MSASKSHLEPEAFQLFRQDKTGVEISELLGISEQTVSRWRKRFKWDERRRAWKNSTIAISEKLMTLLAEDVKTLDKLDGASMDRINKAVSSIKQLDRDVDVRASTIQVFEEFIGYLQSRDNNLSEAIQEVLPDFLLFIGQKFKKS